MTLVIGQHIARDRVVRYHERQICDSKPQPESASMKDDCTRLALLMDVQMEVVVRACRT